MNLYSDRPSSKNAKAQAAYSKAIRGWMKDQGKNIRAALEAKYSQANKADGLPGILDAPGEDDGDQEGDEDLQPELLALGKPLPPLERHTIRAIALLGWAAIEWRRLAEISEPYLSAAHLEGARIGIEQVKPYSPVSSADLKSAAEAAADRYAADRSAAMIGMRREAEGAMARDISAIWPLTSVFARDLVATAKQAVEENWTASQLSAVIEASYSLSEDRGNKIAEVELANAQGGGQYDVWLGSKAIQIVRWRVNPIKEREIDECDEFEAQGNVPIGHVFAPGIRWPRAHPYCNCYLEAVPTEPMQ